MLKQIGMWFGAALAVWCGFPLGTAQASCGLDHCPMDAAERLPGPALAVQVQGRHTVMPGEVGSYSETFVGGVFRREGLGVAARLPLVAVFQEDSQSYGMGNAVAMLDWKFSGEDRLIAFALGGQLEIPTATNDTLGDSHWLVLPYLRSKVDWGSVDANVHVGGAQVLGGGSQGHDGHSHSHDHAHEDDGFVINEHTASEFLGRFELGWNAPVADAAVRTAALFDLVAPLEGEPAIGSVGLAVDWAAGDNVFRLMVMGAVTEARRSTGRVGFGVTHATDWAPRWL
ncbi:MAG: hypothetical protein VX519_09860 [Myxococcota bacterium]|nr:hypothetical protein [Myxococcota bacterium]